MTKNQNDTVSIKNKTYYSPPITSFHHKACKYSSKGMKLIQPRDQCCYVNSFTTDEHTCHSLSHVWYTREILKTARHPKQRKQFYSLKQCCHLVRETFKKQSFSFLDLSQVIGSLRQRGKELTQTWTGKESEPKGHSLFHHITRFFLKTQKRCAILSKN